MGKKSPPPKPPDLKPISDAQMKIAEQSNELAREFLGLSREQFAWMQENAGAELEFTKEQAGKLFGLQEKAGQRDDEMLAISRKVSDKQLAAMDEQAGWAREDRARWKDTFLPMQDRMIAEANAYDTPERREAEAARAMADVTRGVEAQRANADARLRSMGLDPSQIRSTSMATQVAVAGGANQAMAGNAARQQIEDRGRAMRADAVNMGMGLPSQAAQGFAGSTNSANSAGAAGSAMQQGLGVQAGLVGQGVGMRSNALGQYGALTGSPTQWASMGGGMMGQASNAYGNAASTMSSNFNNQMASWNAGQQQSQRMFDNVMSVGAMAGGMMMAEGGMVRRRRRRPVYRAEGGPIGGIERESFSSPLDEARMRAKARVKVDGNTAAGNIVARMDPSMRDSIRAQHKAMTPSMSDRVSSGLNAMSAAQANRGTAGSSVQEFVPAEEYRQHQFAQLPIMAAEGGALGAIPRRQARDKVNAVLTEGEYVVPADVVQAVGIEKLDKLVAKYHRPGA